MAMIVQARLPDLRDDVFVLAILLPFECLEIYDQAQYIK